MPGVEERRLEVARLLAHLDQCSQDFGIVRMSSERRSENLPGFGASSDRIKRDCVDISIVRIVRRETRRITQFAEGVL